jgi:aspartate/methionine/tyrosine aminotransferase
MFSSRLPSALDENAVTRALSRLRTAGTPIIDLTETNPTSVGLPYPANLHAQLASPSALTYAPEPLGLPAAREAVSREYARQGAVVPPDRIVLTVSTSEAYSLLFKLLCDAGDEVLIPQPSYPLFELLSRLDNVTTVPYALHMHAGWSLDRASIERALSPRTRAVLVVSPNNPTGSIITQEDTEWLADLCAARGIAMIADEVFADFRFSRPSIPSLPHSLIPSLTLTALTFSLGGLSKSAGLPQVKLGWMAVSGPDALVTAALAKLELIADTYLSVATPVQVAAASLIEGGAVVRAAIQARVTTNLARCRELIAARPDVTLLEPDAGWCVVLQVPATESEEHIVMRLLEQQHVLVHPGYFFDFPKEAFLVLSLLPPPDVFADGLARVLDEQPL